MPSPALKMEVRRLDALMEALADQVMRTSQGLDRLSHEMRDFKNEMGVFKDEMRVFKDEMGVFKDEMGDFKQEMRDFKQEMRDFKDEMRADRKALNKTLGDLSNRLGTLVEDIVAPNLPRISAELLGCGEPSLAMVRVKRRFDGQTREYDAVVVCDDAVLVNETKSNLLVEHVDKFLERLRELPAIFPEYADRRIVGVLASLSADDGLVAYASRRGLGVLTMGDETMVLRNAAAVRAVAGPDAAA